MATFRRAVTPGATYFFTVNTYRRQALLTDPPVYSALREAAAFWRSAVWQPAETARAADRPAGIGPTDATLPIGMQTA